MSGELPRQDETGQREVRFAFGRNWRRYLDVVDERRISRAVQSLAVALDLERLDGRSFLDVGCGSGLFSLAARRLGARVLSIDLDPECVACSEELRRRYDPGDEQWQIRLGSALDRDLLCSLGAFDVVYSWGVLHHTGHMWHAIENMLLPLADDGALYIALYNDQGHASRRWARIKRLYNRLPGILRFVVLLPAFARIWGPTMIRDALSLRPFHAWRNYDSVRGMSAWTDLVDWVGGYPFETAKPEEVFDALRRRGLTLTYLRTCGGGRGCNEFVFRR